jgi:hypothetical protein
MGGNRPIIRPLAHVRHPAPGTRCPPKLVHHHLGHASITMTLDRYSHWIAPWEGTPPTAWTRLWVSYCCPTAAKPSIILPGAFLFLQYLQVK